MVYIWDVLGFSFKDHTLSTPEWVYTYGLLHSWMACVEWAFIGTGVGGRWNCNSGGLRKIPQSIDWATYICTHIYIYTCIHAHVYACVFICTYLNMRVHIYIYTCIYIHEYACFHLHIFEYVCTYISIYIYVYVYTYMCSCVCIYIYNIHT